jgi:hypothetical protein
MFMSAIRKAQKLVRMFSSLGIGSVSDLCLNFRTIYMARNRIGTGLSYRPAKASTFKLLRGPGIDSKESIPPAYDILAGLHDDPILLGSYIPRVLKFQNRLQAGLLNSIKILSLSCLEK